MTEIIEFLRRAVATDPAKCQIMLTHGEAEQILAWMEVSVRDEGAPGGLCHAGHDWQHGFAADRCTRCGVYTGK